METLKAAGRKRAASLAGNPELQEAPPFALGVALRFNCD
jgi:hypothetical protein